MKRVCVINNYNYAKYLRECVASALSQTLSFDLIYVVDDGSTDDSRDVLENIARQDDRIHLIFKENAGQLSCFNALVGFFDDSDLICFLDADDFYPSDYLMMLSAKHSRMKSDFYFCEPIYFRDEVPVSCAVPHQNSEFVWAISSHATRYLRCWVGSPTSCISVTGRLFNNLFPYPFEPDWRTRADDVIVYGAGIFGYAKCYVPDMGVGYRVHSDNFFYGKVFSGSDLIRHEMVKDRLFFYYANKWSLPTLVKQPMAAKEVALVPPELRDRFQLPSDKKMAIAEFHGLRRFLRKITYPMWG